MKAVAVILGAALLCAAPAFAGEDFTTAVKEALESAEPATAVLRGLAKLPDFDMNGSQVAEALVAAGAKKDSPVTQVFAGVQRLTKKKNQIEIKRTGSAMSPIVIGGVTKGWVQLDDDVKFTIATKGNQVVLDDFDGVSIGKTKDDLHSLWNILWTPGEPDSTLSITAGWTVFSQTVKFKVPSNARGEEAGLPPPKTAATTGDGGHSEGSKTTDEPAAPPAATPGMASKLTGG
jgi:hypothetical protein